VPIESDAVHITTPGKSGERWFRASAIVKSRAWYAPRRTSVCTSNQVNAWWGTIEQDTYDDIHCFVKVDDDAVLIDYGDGGDATF
jgi:hypothetical protein